MSENKCPMPGCDGEIIYHGTEFGTDYDSWHGCTKCHFMCDLDHLPHIAAAMELARVTADDCTKEAREKARSAYLEVRQA